MQPHSQSRDEDRKLADEIDKAFLSMDRKLTSDPERIKIIKTCDSVLKSKPKYHTTNQDGKPMFV